MTTPAVRQIKRSIPLTVATILLLFCGNPAAADAQQLDPFVQQVLSEMSVDSLMRTVRDLSGADSVTIGDVRQKITTRFINTPGHLAARAYLKQKIELYGLTPELQVVDTACTNLLITKVGIEYPNRKWIISAHYDANPEGRSTPGADDNATGVATVLEAARLLSYYQSKYTIVFALWDWEEVGMAGSVHYATSAYHNHDTIVGVINIDMIGYDSNDDGKMEIQARTTSQQLADTLVNVNTLYGLGLDPVVRIPGETNSDHGSFWEWNFNAIWMIESYTTGDFNPGYHNPHDSVQYINAGYFEKNAKLAIASLATVAGVISEALPIQLAGFNAVRTRGSSVELRWRTMSEVSNYGFEVQRAPDVTAAFATLAGSFTPGHGTTVEPHEYAFTDPGPVPGRPLYLLKQYDLDGTIHYSNPIVVNGTTGVAGGVFPAELSLSQNYPNPFNPATTITFTVGGVAAPSGASSSGVEGPASRNVKLVIYDLLGREVATLVNEKKEAGSYVVRFDGSGLASGTYFCRLTAGNFVQTRRMTLIK